MSRAPFHTWRKIYRKCITFIHNCPALTPPAVMLTGKFPIPPPPLISGSGWLAPPWRSGFATGLIPTYLSFHLQFRMILNAFPKARPPRWSLLMTTLPSKKKKTRKEKVRKKGEGKKAKEKGRHWCVTSILATCHENCAVLVHFCAEVITSCLY